MEIKRKTYEAKYNHKTKTYSPKVVITATRPDISEEERERRMARIREAAVDLILATARAKKKREEAEQLEKERTER